MGTATKNPSRGTVNFPEGGKGVYLAAGNAFLQKAEADYDAAVAAASKEEKAAMAGGWLDFIVMKFMVVSPKTIDEYLPLLARSADGKDLHIGFGDLEGKMTMHEVVHAMADAVYMAVHGCGYDEFWERRAAELKRLNGAARPTPESPAEPAPSSETSTEPPAAQD
jgi:hypothetical protein